MDDTKASNPKEAFGDAKVPMDLAPDTAVIELNTAFLEGALKYGRYNWRIAGVKASTYVRAARRHLAKWWNGQDRDPVTQVRELSSAMACCAIILDAELCGMLNDDRPPRADVAKQLDETMALVAHLKQLFEKHTPIQYTEKEHGKSAEHVPMFVQCPMAQQVGPKQTPCCLPDGHKGDHHYGQMGV